MSNEEVERLAQSRLVSVPTVLVVKPIVASPGDRLLVFEGVCLGVDTSRTARPSLPAPEATRAAHTPARISQQAKPAPKAAKPARAAHKPAKRQQSTRGRSPDSEVAERRSKIIALLLERGEQGATKRDISSHTGSDISEFQSDMRALRAWVKHTEIVGKHQRDRWVYTLTTRGRTVAQEMAKDAAE